MAKIIDSTNLGHLISKIKAAFWPKSDVVQIDIDNSPTLNSDNFVKSGGVYSAIADKYTKPSTGIPASDLASGVIPTVPVQDVTVGGTSVLSNGTAVVPAIPTVPDISTDISEDATSDTKTASPKAVKTYVDNYLTVTLINKI